MRFTQKRDSVYAVLLGTPEGGSVGIRGLRLDTDSTVELLGFHRPLSWEQRSDGVVIALSGPLTGAPAHAFRITPAPGFNAP